MTESAFDTTSQDRPSIGGPNRAAGLARPLLIAVVLVAVMLIVHYTPVRAALNDAQQLRAAVQNLGAWVYPISILVSAILVASGTPRLLLCAAGGMVLGFWLGLLLVQTGTMLGHYAVFLFIRWGGREWVLRKWPKLRKWAEMIHEQGIAGVVLIRLLPGHSLIANVCLALSHVKHRDFLIGTLIGLLPEAIPATLIGAGLVNPSASGSAVYLALAGVVVAGAWIACRYALRTLRSGPQIESRG